MARKFKRGGAPGLEVNGRIYTVFQSKPTYQPREGVKSFMISIILLWLSIKLKLAYTQKEFTLHDIVIDSAITNLPDQLRGQLLKTTNKENLTTHHTIAMD